MFPRIAHKPGRRHSVALSLPRERPFDAEWCKMVLKTEVCRFSGLKIYPGHGMRLTKMDSQTYLFLSAKCKRLFNLRLRPAKLAWTTQYRKAHKKVRTRRTMRLRRARCALSRDVDVVSRVDARRRTARPLGKSHRSRVLGFFGHSARTGLGRHARDISSHAASPSADRRGYRRARAPVRRYPHDATPRRRRLRLARGTENRFRAGSRRRCHPGHRRRLRWFPRVNAERLFWRLEKRNAHRPKRDAHPFEPSIVKKNKKQDQTTEIARKKKRSVKTNNRSIVGASLEVIQKKRAEKSDVRAAARDAALREIKERQRKAKDAKKGKK